MGDKKKKFGIYIPSYKRADTTTTYKLLEYYKYVVRKSEEEQYLKVIQKENLIAVPDEEICNIVKVVNWIIDNSEEDIIAMVDDDIKNFIYRMDTNVTLEDPEIITSEIERIAQLMLDLDIGYGATDASRVPWGYGSEFEFKGTTGGLRWINKKIFKSKFREDIGYCCDMDAVLHELMVNRIILKPKYLCTNGGTDTNAGGNSQKTRSDQIASFEMMKHKWGKYFDYDLKSNKVYVRVKR